MRRTIDAHARTMMAALALLGALLAARLLPGVGRTLAQLYDVYIEYPDTLLPDASWLLPLAMTTIAALMCIAFPLRAALDTPLLHRGESRWQQRRMMLRDRRMALGGCALLLVAALAGSLATTLPLALAGMASLLLAAWACAAVLLAVVAAVLFLRLLDLVERTSDTRARPAWLRPIALGLVIAALGMFEPRVLGTGQPFVSQLLEVQDFGEQLGVLGFGTSLLLLLAVGKIIATSLTIAAGGSGGAFMPSLFIGATLGAGFA